MAGHNRSPWMPASGSAAGPGTGASRHTSPSAAPAYNAYDSGADRYSNRSPPHPVSDRRQQPVHPHQQPWFDPTTDIMPSVPVTSSPDHRSTSSTLSSGNSATSRHALRGRGQGHNGDEADGNDVRILVAFTFVLEIVVLIGMSVFEYYLRATDYFPVREVMFSCTDPELSYPAGQLTYSSFAYSAEVPYVAVVIISFCLPPFILSVGELALWFVTPAENQKTITVLCRLFRVPQAVRRILRFTGTFIFGLLVTMIFVDVTKLMTGRLRPTFLNTCNPNLTACVSGDFNNAANVCNSSVAAHELRVARLSFPSMQAAMTAFSACFVSIYIHNVMCAGHKVRVLRLFLGLGFAMMSLLCGLARYGLNYNHWVDVAVGFGIGVVLAIYIGVFVLNNFRERLTGRRLYAELQRALATTDELHVVPGSWLAAPQNEVPAAGGGSYKQIGGVIGDGGNYTWLPGQAAIIIPRPRLKNEPNSAAATNGTVIKRVNGVNTAGGGGILHHSGQHTTTMHI